MISWTCAEETNKFKPSLSWRTKNDWHWKWQTELKIRQKTKGGANETVSVCDRDWGRIWIWERVFCVGKTCSERERERLSTGNKKVIFYCYKWKLCVFPLVKKCVHILVPKIMYLHTYVCEHWDGMYVPTFIYVCVWLS